MFVTVNHIKMFHTAILVAVLVCVHTKFHMSGPRRFTSYSINRTEIKISISLGSHVVPLHYTHTHTPEPTLYEGRLQISWARLITLNRNFVEVRWRSFSKYLPWQAIRFLQRSTHFTKTCCTPLITSKFASELPFHGWKSAEIAWGAIWIEFYVRLGKSGSVEAH
jgi:hypothetical protein